RLVAEERRGERSIRLDEIRRRESLVGEHVPERRDHHHDREGEWIARKLLARLVDRVRCFYRIDQHLDDRDPALPELRLKTLQVLQLHGADRAPAREEVHDDGLPEEITRREWLAIERLRLEAGKGPTSELLRDGRNERRLRANECEAERDRYGDAEGRP